MTTRRAFALLPILALVLLAGAGPASAGEYPVYACEPTAGDVNNSWSSERNHGGIEALVLCPAVAHGSPYNRGLVVRSKVLHDNPNATIPEGSWGALVLRAPPGTVLSRIAFTHAFCAWNSWNANIMFNGFTPLRSLGPGRCGSLTPAQETVSLGGASDVRLLLRCFSPWCKNGATQPLGWATMRSATVWVADHSPPAVHLTGGSALAYGWQRGELVANYSASDNVGIRGIRLDLGTSPQREELLGCDYTRVVPCGNPNSSLTISSRSVPDGLNSLTIHATDAAGNVNAHQRPILVDNTPPTSPQSLQLEGAPGWRRTNGFVLSWRNPAQTGTAPISGAQIGVCPATNPADVWTECVFRNVGRADISSAEITVPREGRWVARVTLGDAAGNLDRGAAQSVPLHFDASAPKIAFAGPDVTDPARVEVHAADETSPLERYELELRRRGAAAWIPVAVTPTATGFAGYIDDERLPNGVYDLRARVFDSAGNEASTDRDPSGVAMVRKVPLRIDTRLVAGQVKRQRVAKRSRGKKPRTRRVIVVRPRVRYGRTIPISGRLTTPGGNPIAQSGVEVFELSAAPGASWRRVAVIGTDRKGRFRFKAKRGPSRVLRFRYPGTPFVRARSTEVKISVQARSSIRASATRVVNGEEVVFRGRVRGGPLPSTGKLLQLQVYSRGGWRTFATPRADAGNGRWKQRYRFTATRGTVRYRFRARVPREAGFPYDAGSSRTVAVSVQGL